MNELVLNDIYGVTERKGIPVVSSRKVAERFNKNHQHVLRDIRTAIEVFNKIGESKFGQSNFIENKYKDSQNKKQPEYLLTKDGFYYITMGFNGIQAAKFKIEFIRRFDEMQYFIKSLYEAKADFPEFTDAIMALHEEPKHYHFSNELDMINVIVLGMKANKFKQVNNLGDVSSIRPYLNAKQIEYIKTLQRVDIGLCVAIPDYYERKKRLSEYFSNIVLKKIA
jgi:Rha family phage regulatory protein